MRIITRIIAVIVILILALAALVWSITFHPKDLQNEAVHNHPDAPMLQRGQSIKVLSWNLQYMASKNYEFWYDRIEGDGPDVSSVVVAKVLESTCMILLSMGY